MTDYETGCRGKRAYSKRDAKRAVRRTLTTSGVRRIAGKGPLKPYHCTLCGWWHVGHPKLRRVA